MPKERLPMVQPIGGGSGITSDGRLVSGVTGRGRAVSLSDGHVAQRPAPPVVLPITPPTAAGRRRPPHDLLSATPFMFSIQGHADHPFSETSPPGYEYARQFHCGTTITPWYVLGFYAPYTCSTIESYQAYVTSHSGESIDVSLPTVSESDFAFPSEITGISSYEQRGMSFYAHSIPPTSHRDPNGNIFSHPVSARAGEFHLGINQGNYFEDGVASQFVLTVNNAETTSSVTIELLGEAETTITVSLNTACEVFACIRQGWWNCWYATDDAPYALYVPWQKVDSTLTHTIPKAYSRYDNLTICIRQTVRQNIMKAEQDAYLAMVSGTIFAR